MAKLCIYILHKNSSKRNVMKENYHSNKFLNYLLVGFTKFFDGIISSYQKSNNFVGRIYQLKNFDMNFKGCHLGCQLRTHTRKLIANYIDRKMKYLECVNVVSLPVGKQNNIGYEMYKRV